MKSARSEFFKKLTWSDIQAWAGDTITSRGQNYQRSQAVRDLALTPGGGLVAWVQGTERYATRVDIEDEELTSDCTCPYGGTCKHAVAVVLDYLEKQNKDQLITLLETIAERYPAAKDFLIDHFQLALGEVEKLVHSTRKEIDRLSAEPGWRNSWSGEGEIPDYSEVRYRLGREAEWQSYITGLRSANFRKIRFIEVINRLSGKPIIETEITGPSSTG